jgi:lysophospholipid acyltransferase (LPLAT)-like uncharacterized protein
VTDDARRGTLTRAQRLAIAIGPWLIRVLASTWRVRVINESAWRERHHRGEPYVLSFWHGSLLPLVPQHQGQGIAVLISEHRDGEVIARIVERFGLRTLRGSTSRGAARALLALSRSLEAGIPIAVTPDGPRGPRFSYAPGGVIAAQRGGAPIISMGVHASRAWRLRSWDQFMIPKPFSAVVIAYSDAVFTESRDARGAQAEVERFSAILAEMESLAAGTLPASRA